MLRAPTPLLFSLLLALPAAAPASTDAPALRWQDWNAGLPAAAKSGRPVLVDVYTDWCGWCRRMDRDVYARPDVRDYLAREFVTVKLNAEAGSLTRYEGRDYSCAALASRFRVTGYPTTIFLRPDGTHLVNVPGYVPAERFLMLLRYIREGAMDRGVPFDQYVKDGAR